jgi:pyruvate ferredoxin oxidoreductase beta subunit
MSFAGRDTIVVNATGCVEVTTSFYPYTSWGTPYIHSLFENAPAVVSGIERAIKVLMRKGKINPKEEGIRDSTKVIVIAGDGATYDIGLQSLSGMLERGHRILYVLYDNEAYMNTGIQRSGATPRYAWTTTTPAGKPERKKDIMKIVMAHGIPYAATCSIHQIVDLGKKFEKAVYYLKDGPTFLHILAPCVPGWRYPENQTIKTARLAVETGYFPLYEWEKGEFKLSPSSERLLTKSNRKPIKDFLKMQERFAHLTEEEINEIQKEINDMWEEIKNLVSKQKNNSKGKNSGRNNNGNRDTGKKVKNEEK